MLRALKVLKELQPEDFKVLHGVERGMMYHEYVPMKEIPKFSGLTIEEVSHRLSRVHGFKLVYRWVGPYTGYALNYDGYDCLALNTLVQANILQSLGKPLGIGKEADVYDALTVKDGRAAVKFHRLGRESFRKTRRVRGYVKGRGHAPWLYQSRLAAKREFKALTLLYPQEVSVPKPIAYNRHVLVMGMVEGDPLNTCNILPDAYKVLSEVVENLKAAYLKAGVIHSDLSEYNVILTPSLHVMIIDWPQWVSRDHPNADMLLRRDLSYILKYFRRKHNTSISLEEAIKYVKEA